VIESVDVIIRQPGQPDRTVRLPSGDTFLGRADDNGVVLPDVGVSRRHARLSLTDDQLVLYDLGSGNGTYFNGGKVQDQMLRDGDEVVIDPFVLSFRVKGSHVAAPRALQKSPARLEVVVGSGVAGSTYPLTSDFQLTIGRSEERDLVIPDPAASRHHATVMFDNGKWVLRDEGSANGVFVNESRVRRAALLDNDVIRIGNTEFRFLVTGSELGDTTTQVVPGEVWNPQAGRSQAAISAAATPSPLPEVAAVDRGGRGTLVAALLGGVVALLVLLAGVSVILLGLVLYFTGTVASNASHRAPSVWVVEHKAPIPRGEHGLDAPAHPEPAAPAHGNWIVSAVSEQRGDAVAKAVPLLEG
jgi:pSer/pThr/pTyr-binding forkhead associated (FHA) protein